MSSAAGPELLRDEEAASWREWLVTNGLGGYASSSLSGANTRRYHGLLVAALQPPLGRAVLLSKLEETLLVSDADGVSQQFGLSTNFFPDVTSPVGYSLLESWTDQPAPTWVWNLAPGLKLEKRVWMARGQNVSYIAYRLLSAPEGSSVELRLTPLTAWKDYHSEQHAGGNPPGIRWEAAQSQLILTLPEIWNVTSGPIDVTLKLTDLAGNACSDVRFEEAGSWWYRFQHPRERERGLDAEEDLFAPGDFVLKLCKGDDVIVTAGAGLEAVPTPAKALLSWNEHRADLLRRSAPADAFSESLTLAADQFVVQVPGKRTTVIAGYPWFSDWGRDTMIALPGLCLSAGRPEIAREILLSFAESISDGMLPNRFPDRGEVPEYNTVDATLWYFAALWQFVEATGETGLVTKRLWEPLNEIIQWHINGTRYQIHMDTQDCLLFAGQPGVQLTWMDAKVGDWVVTPRIGKPVEINALWHNALRIMERFAGMRGDTAEETRFREMADNTGQSFLARYPRADGTGLYDVLDVPPYHTHDAGIRPNQIFAVSLPFAPIRADSPLAKAVIAEVERDLLTPWGLRTLSPSDPNFRPRYEGDQWSRDGAYHQGTAWIWLLGAFVEAHWRAHHDRKAARSFLEPMAAHLTAAGMGSLAEVADGADPQRPGGCIAQAWSVSEILRLWKMLL